MAAIHTNVMLNSCIVGNSSMPITIPRKTTDIKHSLELLSNMSTQVLYKDEHGTIFNTHPALTWDDYYVNEDDEGITDADRVKREFWVTNIYLSVHIHKYFSRLLTSNYPCRLC